MKRVEGKVIIENCSGKQMIFRNFSGAPDKFHPNGGNRDFVFIFEDGDELPAKLAEDGWPIKYRPPLNDGDPERASIRIKVRFDKYPPKVVRRTSKSSVILDAETVGELDVADIESFDICFTPYNWGEGVTAYLKTLYVNVLEDEFAAKYGVFDDDEPPF